MDGEIEYGGDLHEVYKKVDFYMREFQSDEPVLCVMAHIFLDAIRKDMFVDSAEDQLFYKYVQLITTAGNEYEVPKSFLFSGETLRVMINYCDVISNHFSLDLTPKVIKRLMSVFVEEDLDLLFRSLGLKTKREIISWVLRRAEF